MPLEREVEVVVGMRCGGVGVEVGIYVDEVEADDGWPFAGGVVD